MKIIKNKKIFDIRNPNCIISNSIEGITKKFNKTPILNKTGVVGFVNEITSHDENCIYGNLIIWDDSINLGDMINYEFAISDSRKNNDVFEVMVGSINAIYYELSN